MQYGAIFFVLEKMAAVVGVSNLHVYAHMRGQTLYEFQKTRNAQVLYSVGGAEAQRQGRSQRQLSRFAPRTRQRAGLQRGRRVFSLGRGENPDRMFHSPRQSATTQHRKAAFSG